MKNKKYDILSDKNNVGQKNHDENLSHFFGLKLTKIFFFFQNLAHEISLTLFISPI